MVLEEGDMVLCTVDRIAGTVVFVKIEGEEKEGSIILSEIAPGRIRNLREYVIPKKKIVCKVLKTAGGSTSLSLRRVTQKERKEVMDAYNQERSYVSILKSVIKEKSNEIIEKITKEGKLFDFFEETRKDSKKLEELIGKENTKKILDILLEQKKKKIIVKKTIYLKTQEPNGVYLIKNILESPKEIKVKYLSAGKYSINLETEDGKKGEQKIKMFLEEIEKKARESGVQFELKDK
jgi:translation initiation factor 2 alpha subunit (eIF-2alpha)